MVGDLIAIGFSKYRKMAVDSPFLYCECDLLLLLSVLQLIHVGVNYG